MQVKDEYVADVRQYSGPLREAAREADKFADRNEAAALAARRMGLAAKEAAEKASRAQRDAADAAEKLARGEFDAEEAAQAAARAERELERASIKAAEAQRANAKAADAAARQYRQVARDAELAAAAQRLGALKAAGAVKEHNAVVQELRKKYGDVEKIGGAAFREIEKTGNLAFRMLNRVGTTAFDGITSAASKMANSGPGSIALVVAALGSVPFAALGATSAISLGVGGALAGLGLMAVKGDKDVKGALSNMKANVAAEAKEIAKPFKQTWIDIAHTAQSTFHGLAPELQHDFAELAPAVSGFFEDAGDAALKLRPAFRAATNATDELLAQLGPRLPEISENVGHSIEIMANSAEKSAPAFANMMVGVSEVLPPLAHLLDLATKLGPIVSPIFNLLTRGSGAAHQFGTSLSGAGSAADGTAQSMSTSAMHTQQLLSAQKAATMTSEQLKTALDALTGANQSAFDAQTQYRQALNAAAEQAKKSNAGINGNSKAALENRQALSQLATAIKNNIQVGNLSAKQIEGMRNSFIRQAEGMGISRKEATQLANELLGVSGNAKKIPDKKTLKLEASGAGHAKDQIQQVAGEAKKTARYSNLTFTLHAADRATGIARKAASVLKDVALGPYRATLKAVSVIGPVVSGATNLAKRFAGGNYRATLRAISAVSSAYNSAMSLGRSWASKVFSATFGVVKKIFSADGGPVEGYADGGDVGGPVRGPGTGTSDSIPAMLSNGEYVIRAAQAAKYRPLLDMINYGVGGFAGGGAVPGYASGGNLKPLTGSKGVSGLQPLTGLADAAYVAAAARVAKARSRPEYASAMAAQAQLEAMRRTIYGGLFNGHLPGVGSAHGTVVQHVTHVSVNVQGSIRSDRDIVAMIQQQILTGRLAVTLPAGR